MAQGAALPRTGLVLPDGADELSGAEEVLQLDFQGAALTRADLADKLDRRPSALKAAILAWLEQQL